MTIKKIRDFFDIHAFLIIPVAISLYFGIHAYLFLTFVWLWEWYLSASTVLLIEVIWLNVFRTKTYFLGLKLFAGIIAMSFCIFLPLVSSYLKYTELEKESNVVIEMETPEYFEDKVIPALHKELDVLVDKISPRIAERDRRLAFGNNTCLTLWSSKRNKMVPYTGTEAASWIPDEGTEAEDFRRVESLHQEIKSYLKLDMESRNAFKKDQRTQTSKIEGLKADVKDGKTSLLFKCALIIVLGFFSFFYMVYYYRQPKKEKDLETKISDMVAPDSFDTLNELADSLRDDPKFSSTIDETLKKQAIIRSKAKKFVLERFPEAVSDIVDCGETVNILASSDGGIIGTAKNAPNSWINARKNIENGTL